MAEAGWYRDKRDPTVLRKWDGTRWTGETADFSAPPPPPEPRPAAEPIDWAAELPLGPRPWWRSPWAIAAGALLVVAVAIGAASRGGGKDETAAAGGSTTSGAADTRTRQTAAPIPVTGTPEQAREAFASIFENGRTPLASILGDDRNVRSLDRFDFDVAAGVVTLGITSMWTTTAERADGAWELTRAVAELYKRGGGQWWQEAYVPSFRLINSGQSHTCTGDLMVQFGNEEQGRPAWEASC